jgi:hypothetical protein
VCSAACAKTGTFPTERHWQPRSRQRWPTSNANSVAAHLRLTTMDARITLHHLCPFTNPPENTGRHISRNDCRIAKASLNPVPYLWIVKLPLPVLGVMRMAWNADGCSKYSKPSSRFGFENIEHGTAPEVSRLELSQDVPNGEQFSCVSPSHLVSESALLSASGRSVP